MLWRPHCPLEKQVKQISGQDKVEEERAPLRPVVALWLTPCSQCRGSRFDPGGKLRSLAIATDSSVQLKDPHMPQLKPRADK